MAALFLIEQSSPGCLWIGPCPKGAHLAQECAAYRALGVDRIVSMLGLDEAWSLGLGAEETTCASEGIAFSQYPIADFGLTDIQDFANLVQRIQRWLHQGHGVAVHCRAGIGRSGMVTAGVLVAQGLSAAQAMKQVAHARGVSIPDTVEQGEFVAKFEQWPK